MRLNSRQHAILLGIVHDVDRLAALPLQYMGDHRERCALASERQRIKDAIEGMVPSNPGSWLGQAMSASDYVACGRDYKTLESLGLIERHALGRDERRTTHLRITDAGRAMVDQIRLEAVRDG